MKSQLVLLCLVRVICFPAQGNPIMEEIQICHLEPEQCPSFLTSVSKFVSLSMLRKKI